MSIPPALNRSRKPAARTPVTHVAVIVPAHDERTMIDPCLAAVGRAAVFARDQGLTVSTVVVCDACTDDTADVAARRGATIIAVRERNVGRARAVGAEAGLAAGADWLAFTDADTIVSPTWLIDQLALKAEAFCGTVGVSDWSPYDEHAGRHFLADYRDADGHRHIHGANFGLSAAAYRRSGGFQPLASSEDVALVEALIAADVDIAWSAKPRVTTSARRDYRAPDGFGATLERAAALLRDVSGRVHEPAWRLPGAGIETVPG